MKFSHIENIINVVKKYPIQKAGVFGSFARGEDAINSDVDIMIEFKRDANLFINFYDLWDDLETILERKVDLLQYSVLTKSTKQKLRENILKDLKWFYEA